MSVPENIRQVPRPVNTVVVDNGHDGPKRYAVRERTGIRYMPGGNPQPHNGKVIGHITDGIYVPLHTEVAQAEPDMLSYGSSAFVRSVTQDILSELLQVYSPNDAYTIMAIASLRVIRPSIVSGRLSTHYSRTFVSVFYPGVSLSANTVCAFLQKLGQDGKKRQRFYHLRAQRVIEDHHIAIDSTLKQDFSLVNDLSAFSYKARIKGCREVSVLYAYDIELMEPICAEVFPGNHIDACSYTAFIRDNDIRQGIIVADKGFPPSMIQDELEKRPNLHFLTPIRRNDTRIADNDMLTYEGILEGIGDHVLYKKRAIKGGHFLYAYKSTKKAAAEEASFLARREKNKDFSPEQYAKKRDKFGIIVLESDLELDPKTAYLCYDDRWLLELVFKRYKSDECLDKTNVQGDFSLLGSEFINFISTVATCRMLKQARKTNLLEDMTYGELMEDLSSAWRMADAPENAASYDGKWVHTLPSVFKELEILGLSTPPPKDKPKKRGRPRKKQ